MAIVPSLISFVLPFMAALLSAQEHVPGRMIGSVNLGMTVRTTPIEIPNRIQQRRSCGMPARDVARIADAWHTHFEQLRIIRSMRLVAVRAILHHRRVLPQEWPTT